MPKFIMCKGLPGSGKSTWAAQQEGFTVINKDLIRQNLRADDPKATEKEVVKKRNQLIDQCKDVGFNVISDDTNFNPVHEKYFRKWCEDNGYEFEINDSFLQVPIMECIDRDSKREKKVGKEVVLDIFYKYMYRPNDHYYYGSVIVCDLDGTLAHVNGRSPYDYSKVSTDKCDMAVREILQSLSDKFTELVILSGREASCVKETVEWLDSKGMEYNALYMRAVGDKRPDWVVKSELIKEVERDIGSVSFILDDRDQCVHTWRWLGYKCLQVGYGNF